MKVKLDQDKCIGCGACVACCPEVYVMDEKTGKAKVKTPKTDKPCAKEGADSCPVQAITISK